MDGREIEVKGIVHPKMRKKNKKNSPWFTHLILGVYDILRSDEYNQSYIKKISWLFQAL